MLTPAMADYLKAVYKLQHQTEPVTTSDVARALSVAPASATNMLKRLDELKLVEHTPYRGVVLTYDGRRAALEIIRHHRLIELYLQHALGYSWDEVDAEAERLEHAITQEFAERIEAALGHPTHDPHGHPIPTRDLEISEATQGEPLSAAQAPDRVRVSVVDDSQPELLRHLSELGLGLGSVVDVVAVAPDGSVTVRVDEMEHHLSADLTSRMTVQSVDTPQP